jgi:hypothetical protein
MLTDRRVSRRPAADHAKRRAAGEGGGGGEGGSRIDRQDLPLHGRQAVPSSLRTAGCTLVPLHGRLDPLPSARQAGPSSLCTAGWTFVLLHGWLDPRRSARQAGPFPPTDLLTARRTAG